MILDEIMEHKANELAVRKRETSLAQLEVQLPMAPPPRDFASAVARPGVSLIAEIKRASPSRGVFLPDLDLAHFGRSYVRHGADAISVLTDERFFCGTLNELRNIRSIVDGILEESELGINRKEKRSVPILRKDFIFDAYQVVEARVYGADALLLIARVLPDRLLVELIELANSLHMTPLVEIHDPDELESKVPIDQCVIGINNRNLADFSVDLGRFSSVLSQLPENALVVAESGIRNGDDVRRVKAMGGDAVLVGEALITASDLAKQINELHMAGRREARQA